MRNNLVVIERGCTFAKGKIDKRMNISKWMLVAVGTVSIVSCKSEKVEATLIPQAPDYNNDTMWVTVDGDSTGTGADVWNSTHREHMGDLEMNKVAAYMSPGNTANAWQRTYACELMLGA